MIESTSSPHMVRVALSGDFDLKEFLHMLEDVGQAMKVGPVRKVLFDDRSLNMKDVTFYDQLDIRNKLLSDRESFANKKIAILMNPSDLPLAKRFKEVTAYASDTIMVDAFPDESEAVRWLEAA